VAPTDIDLTVYPDECDAFGHLNHASFLNLFERARWETLARGPGMDFFSRAGAWPAVRKAAVEYYLPAVPGDVIRFQQTLVHLGRTSFTIRQVARRAGEAATVATGEFLFVCVDRDGRPVAVPSGLNNHMSQHPSDGPVRRVTVNGVTLAVDVVGSGPPILFIHGYPLDRSIWTAQVNELDDWTRIAPDLRGMGQSDAPDLGYSMATYADDLLALLDALGHDRAVLCGLSMGGYVAFEILRQAIHRVRGLILVDTRAAADSPDGKRARDATMVQAREGGAEAIAASMLPRMLARTAPVENPPLVDRVRDLMAATPVAGILGAVGAMRDRPDSTPLLSQLADVPTMIIVGDDDQITPTDQAREMSASIPGARLEVVARAGHLTPMEQPEEVTRLLREFLNGLPTEYAEKGG
jgi:YbgC/YbaW family acyl-CoA thioester hydrolase